MDSSTKAAISEATHAAILADQIKGFQQKLDQARREVIADAKARGIDIDVIGSIFVRPKKPRAYYEAIRKGLAFIVSPSLDGLSRSELRDAVAEHSGFAAVGIAPKAWSSTKLPPRLVEYAESRLIEAGFMAEVDRWNGRGQPGLNTFSKVAKLRLAGRRVPARETGRAFATGRVEFLGNDQVNWFGKLRKMSRKGRGQTLNVRINGQDYGVVTALLKLDNTLDKATILEWVALADERANEAKRLADAQAAAEVAQRSDAQEAEALLADVLVEPKRRTHRRP